MPLALGVVPVGIAMANFGDDDGGGLLPWVEERLAELVAEPPVLFDEGAGIEFEAVAATEPDVILAAYSGLSRSDYDILSRIAPAIGYLGSPWSPDWREMIRYNSRGMGLGAEGEALVTDLKEQIDAAAADLAARDLSLVRFYSGNDTRVRFFEDLGLTSPQSFREATTGGRFAGEVSAERIDAFDDVDILVSYGSLALMETVGADPLLSRMPAVETGAIVLLENDPVGTATNPTPLSIPWVLDDHVDRLAAAARKAE